ncbi:MAG: PIG-L deacetylase family protein, partial [Bacilli bacterium]
RGSHDPTLTPELIADMRRKEMEDAAHRLGAREVVQLGYQDGDLQYATNLKETLFRLVRSIRPDVVITFDPWKRYEIHSDHRVVGFAMIEAAHLGASRHHRRVRSKTVRGQRPCEPIWSECR